VLRGTKAPLFIPLNFPDAPNVGDPETAMNASLAELRHWYLAPTNAGQLSNAGIEFAITSDGLTSMNSFLPNLRAAVARGLSSDAALAALTTTPARYLGIDKTHGTIAAGKVANLVVAKGDLFTREADIRDVWVNGVAYGVTRPAQLDPRGTWTVASSDQWGFEARLVLEGTVNRLRGYLDVSPGPNNAQGARIDLESATVVAETGRLEVRFNGEKLGYEGKALLAGSITNDQFFGWTSLPNGANPSFRGTRTAPFQGDAVGTVAVNVPKIDLPFIRPMMEYGVPAIPQQPAVVFVRNATVWTQGPQGRLEGADVLIRAGKIAEVGKGLRPPAGAIVIDGTGKHVTPGLIDPHIHSGVSDVNETGATIVPEVYMGDVLTHNNIWMYRQLAGGLTTAMVKHGSANPIGGENVIVKMRWGSLPDSLKLEGATRTVKFALGENPKRCCYEGRYPRSRMGTQEIIRDHFLAARDYRREWQEWEKTKKGLPPRRDLRMEALLDILDQKLMISSHGYRADEFLALIRLAEEFGFKVMAIQHGVEAYKIAPELAKAGVAAAVWSDWGAFKMEAYDATKYNVRILMEAGVTVSLHSDDAQIASRMNWEAGKLLRTGLTEEQAMKTVTSNAAKLLRIDNRVGSLEPGKDADFVVWNGDPLSQFTKAEQTWVDGRRYFSLEEDAARRVEIDKERRQLIQAVLAASGGPRAAATGKN
jgi:imidazolonepropionase-like amidohydrolase